MSNQSTRPAEAVNEASAVYRRMTESAALVRPGYKRTEVGDIPEEWTVSSLQDVCRETITYGIVQCGPHIRDGIPYIRVSDMDKPELDVDGMLRTTAAIAAQFLRSTVQEGDLVYALRGKLGEVRQIGIAVAGANLTQGTARLSPKEDVASNYLKWAMRSSRVMRQAEIEAKGTTFREITLADLRRICLPIPPVTEQRAIAAALGDVDVLLDGLERLLAKKRDLKQAAMQQLLTGQTRLPGFSGEWEVKRLTELADIRSGGTPSTAVPQFWDGEIPWSTPTDITALGGRKYLCHTNRMITLHGLKSSSAEMIPAYSIVMTSRATIGECAINTVPVSTNQGFKNFVPFEKTDVEFLYYLLTMQKSGFISLCGGSTFLEIGKAQLAVYQVRLPRTKAEQTAIAAILSDMDAELAALEARRDKTRALKEGMMQELLTGKTRLL